jgi:hypothetical protein
MNRPAEKRADPERRNALVMVMSLFPVVMFLGFAVDYAISPTEGPDGSPTYPVKRL